MDSNSNSSFGVDLRRLSRVGLTQTQQKVFLKTLSQVKSSKCTEIVNLTGKDIILPVKDNMTIKTINAGNAETIDIHISSLNNPDDWIRIKSYENAILNVDNQLNVSDGGIYNWIQNNEEGGWNPRNGVQLPNILLTGIIPNANFDIVCDVNRKRFVTREMNYAKVWIVQDANTLYDIKNTYSMNRYHDKQLLCPWLKLIDYDENTIVYSSVRTQ